MPETSESAFETVIEAHLLANGYLPVDGQGFDRERAIFPEVVLGLIRETQPAEWGKLGALRSETERTIALLRESRAALIAAAVTGKIDVQRGAGGRAAGGAHED